MTTIGLAATILSMVLPLCVIALFAVLLLRRRRNARSATPPPLTRDAHGSATVPVLASFLALRGAPWWWVLGHNSLNPLLAVTPTGVAWRVFWRQERPWAAVERVEVREGRSGATIRVTFTGSALAVLARVSHRETAAAFVAMVPERVRG